MLTRAQQILLKRAQHQAGVSDCEYRDLLHAFAGVRSSTDPRATDEHLDKCLSFLEAVYWRAHDAGDLPAPKGANPVFLVRGYWSGKNTRDSTSRDRFVAGDVSEQIGQAERGLSGLGCGPEYLAAIRRRTQRGDRGDPARYLAALRRTLRAKLSAGA